jgi:predicted DNA-binding transcriptional regulator YafY
MPTDNKQLLRLQILDQCFADQSQVYTFDKLLKACNTSRATLRRDLRYIRDTYGENVFAKDHNRQGHQLIYRYAIPGFTICQDHLDSAQLAQIKSMIIFLNRFMGEPQFEYLQSIIKQLERKHQLDIPPTQAIVHFDGNVNIDCNQYLAPLYEAIINQQCKQIYYKPFTKSLRIYIAHPYLLKEYNRRWYLLCGTQDSADGAVTLRTLPLDRIERLTDIVASFISPQIALPDEEISDYFRYIIGVTRKDNHPVHDIEIKCDPKEFMYISTKPIHPSQRIIPDKPNHIKLRVQENYELYQRLLFYGDKIEVIYPQSIRDEFRKVLQGMLSKYHNKQ